MSQPDAIVPMTLQTPIAASMSAAPASEMPWSRQAGMKCVPMRPNVLAPHTKKLADRSQKSRDPTASPSAASGAVNGLMRGGNGRSGASAAMP